MSKTVEQVLAESDRPLSVDELCAAAYGRVTDRGRNAVHQALYRLRQAGRLVQHAATYALKGKP